MKIAAIIVTCNRRQVLNDLLDDLLCQSRKPDVILVVDNGSEDGTVELVKKHFPLVKLIELKHNIGLMGGLGIGIKTAFEQGYDAVLSMDDDARLRKDTLECLVSAIDTHECLREAVVWCAIVSPHDQFFAEPVCVKVEGEWKIYHEFLPELYDKVYETIGGSNVGLFIPRSVIEHVGLPREELVFNGEFEFNDRIKKGGFKLFRCFASIIYHERNRFSEIKIMGKTRFVSRVPPWRTYYDMRNRIYIDRIQKRRTMLKSLLLGMIESAVWIYTSEKKISTAFYISKAVYDGLLGKMGMRVKIPRELSERQ
jgi:GT2 family glycosyltransferase